MKSARDKAYDRITKERIRQQALLAEGKIRVDMAAHRSQLAMTGSYGPKFLVLAEEVGEVARAIHENASEVSLHEELVQAAAVVVAWLESFE